MDVLSFFYKIVDYRHFHIFNMAFKMAANGHVTYILTLVQKVKYRVYKIHDFFKIKQSFANTLQVISFKKDVYFLHGRS